MGFILDSLTNIMVEALDTLILWVCNLSVTFRLDIGESGSIFSTVFPASITGKVKGGTNTISIEDFATAIGAIAVMLLLLVTILKIYQLLLSPNARSESPGEIVIKFILSLAGIVMAYPIFRYIQKGFNAAYSAFTLPYERITKVFKYKNVMALKKAEEISSAASSEWVSVKDGGSGSATVEAGNTTDAFLLGSDHLINPKDGIMEHPFALALIELFVGIALMMALIKLIFEIYERYVILAVLYLFSPLAFMSLITKGGEVFRSYWWMVFSQFILMCSNLVFLTIFMAAWYQIIEKGTNMEGNAYFFNNSQQFVTTMLLLISWLIVGQKFDELLKGLGLNAATTGQGIMGAALGSVAIASMLLGGASAGAAATGKFLTGQTGTQRALRDGTGLVGKIGNIATGGLSSASAKKAGNLPKAVEGKDMNDALNNMVKGANGTDGLAAKPLGSQGSSTRQNFNAANLKWEPLKDNPGISQAYDASSNTTYTMGTTNEANTVMQNNFGEKIGTDGSRHPGELGRIRYSNAGTSDNSRLVHVSPGNSVGKMPERSLSPQTPKAPKGATSV